jgi:hypothetical protein
MLYDMNKTAFSLNSWQDFVAHLSGKNNKEKGDALERPKQSRCLGMEW